MAHGPCDYAAISGVSTQVCPSIHRPGRDAIPEVASGKFNCAGLDSKSTTSNGLALSILLLKEQARPEAKPRIRALGIICRAYRNSLGRLISKEGTRFIRGGHLTDLPEITAEPHTGWPLTKFGGLKFGGCS